MVESKPKKWCESHVIINGRNEIEEYPLCVMDLWDMIIVQIWEQNLHG